MSEILKLWGLIIDEAISLQNEDGSVNNIIVNQTYDREAAFSIYMLLTDWRIRGSDSSLELARKNIAYCEKKLDANGIRFDEPVWTPRGVAHRKGSLPATVMFIEALHESTTKFHDYYQLGSDKIRNLSDYLQSCYLSTGRFSHDSKVNSRNDVPVVNTSAMAAYLISIARSYKVPDAFDPEKIIKSIEATQLQSGLFPYCFESFHEKILRTVSNSLPNFYKKLSLKALGDKSMFFGDFLHHVVTLLYLLKIDDEGICAVSDAVCRKAWIFIENNLIDTENGLKLNFDWEPNPGFPRYSNFIDVTSYFCLFQIVYYLEAKSIINKSQADRSINGFIIYILEKLIDLTSQPCIKPYQGSESTIKNIFPRPAESVFHKGFLLAKYLNLKDSGAGGMQ